MLQNEVFLVINKQFSKKVIYDQLGNFGMDSPFLHSNRILLPSQLTDTHKPALDHLIYFGCLHYTSVSVSLW